MDSRRTEKITLKSSWPLGASIKPGTRNIPEHAGKFRNIPEHEKIKIIFMEKKYNKIIIIK